MDDSAADVLRSLQIGENVSSRQAAALATRIGNYTAAQHFYEQELTDQPNDSVLAIEYAKLLFRECCWGKCSSYLADMIQRRSRNPADVDFTNDQHNFMLLLQKAAGIFSDGALRPALAQARDAREWLLENQYHDITGSKVSGLSIS
jgi:predicted Zn-dependent protease